MNTATPLFHERLRAFFSRFSFILKAKYDFFRHHSRVVRHHDLHKSPLSQTIHDELEAEKELISDFFSSLFQSIGHRIRCIFKALTSHMPTAATSNEKNGLIPFQSKISIVRRPYWWRRRPLSLPRPSLPQSRTPILIPPPPNLPLRDQR